MDRILVATDLSPRSDRAVSRAFRIAGKTGASVTVLTVMPGELPPEVAQTVRRETEAHLERFCSETAGKDTVPWTATALPGDPATVIHDVARAENAGLIVVGLHGKRAILDSVRETTLERIVRHTERPVLLVHDPADHGYRSILAPIDVSPAATAALAAARKLAPDARIRAFHAVHASFTGMGTDDTRAAMRAGYLRDAEAAIEAWRALGGVPEGVGDIEVVEGALSQVFDAEVLKERPDLVAIGAHARHGLAYRVLGGFAHALVREPPTDLLIACR